MQGYLAPPIFAVFFLGVFMKRLNAAGCLAALVTGFPLGVFRLVDRHAGDAEDGGLRRRVRTELVALDRAQYVTSSTTAVLIFLVSAAVLIGVSYATAPPPPQQLVGLTFATVTDEQRRESRPAGTRRT